MRTQLAVWMTVAVIAAGASEGWAQRGSERGGRMPSTGATNNQGTINYNDLSKRSTQKSEREDRKEKAAEEAKKKSEEEKRRAEREKRYGNDRENRDGKGMVTTKAGDSKTTSGAKGKGGPKRATQPIIAGGSSDPTMKEVTEVMLEAVKTQKVSFDPATAKEDPDMIILNAPKFDATQRTRAGDSAIAKPL